MDVQSNDVRKIKVPENLQPLLGTEVSYIPKGGEAEDLAAYNAIYPQVLKNITKKGVSGIKAAKIPVTSELVLSKRKEWATEAQSLTTAWLGEMSGATKGGAPGALTRSKDTLTLSQGELPEGKRIPGQALKFAQETGQAFWAVPADAIGVKKPAAKAIGGVLESLPAPLEVKGLFNEEGDVVIPAKVGLVPTRAFAAMLYPESGWEMGGFNVVTKLAQDVVYAFVATGEATKKNLDKKREDGEEITFYDYLEAREEAYSGTEAISLMRDNRSSFEAASEDMVSPERAAFWVASKALTGESFVDLTDALITKGLEKAGVSEATTDVVTDTVTDNMKVSPTGMIAKGNVTLWRSPYDTYQALVGGYDSYKAGNSAGQVFDDAMFARTGKGERWTSEEIAGRVLGPMTVAIASPDLFMGTIKGFGLLKKGYKSIKGSVYAAPVAADRAVFESILVRVDEAVESGKPINLEGLDTSGLTTVTRNRLDEIMRSAAVVPDTQNTRSIAKGINENLAKADELDAALAAKVAESRASIGIRESTALNIAQAQKAQKAKAAESAAKTKAWNSAKARKRPRKAKPYRPAASLVGKRGSAERAAAYGMEAKAIQHRAFASSVTEKILDLQIKTFEAIGKMGKAPTKPVAKLGESKAALQKALERFRAAANSSDEAGMAAAIREINAHSARITRHGQAAGLEALKSLRKTARDAVSNQKKQLEELRTFATKDKKSIGVEVEKAILAIDEQAETLTTVARNAMSGSANSAKIAASLRTSIEGLRKAEVILKRGDLLVPASKPLPVEFARFEAMEVAEQLTYVEKMVGADQFARFKRIREGKKLLEGTALDPLEASNAMRWVAESGAGDDLSAWAMSAYSGRAKGVNLISDVNLSSTYKVMATVEGFFKGLPDSGMRKFFQFVGGRDIYNSGRYGLQQSDAGLDALSNVLKKARKSKEKDPNVVIDGIKELMTTTPEKAGSLYGQAGAEAPLQEAMRFFRSLSDVQLESTMSFKVMARSFLGSGAQTADATGAMLKELIRIVRKEDPLRPDLYEYIVARMNQTGGTATAGKLDIKSQQTFANAIVNASANQRMIERLSMQQAGFSIDTLRAAEKLSGSAGSQTVSKIGGGKETLGRITEARALSEKLGISFENLRAVSVSKKGGDGATWGLTLIKDGEAGLQAVVPRPLMEALSMDLSWALKAKDLGTTWKLGVDLTPWSMRLNTTVRLLRKSMTSGIFLPRPSYFVNNIHGAITQAFSSADATTALTATLDGVRGVRRPMLLGGKKGTSLINTGDDILDAHAVEAMRRARKEGDIYAASRPTPIVANSHPVIRGMLDDAVIPPDQMFRLGSGEVVTKRRLLQEMLEEGVFETKSREFLLEKASARSVREGEATVMDGSMSLKSLYDRALSRTDYWASCMDQLEKNQRIGMFLHSRASKGMTGSQAGRLTREAYFDWAYPPAVFTNEAMSRVPLMMFASMWKNAMTHTLAVLGDPTKAKRMMDIQKMTRVGAGAASDPGAKGRRPSFANNNAQEFVMKEATEEQADYGFRKLGARTGFMAYSIPEMISMGLIASTIHSALTVSYGLRRGFKEPMTRDGWDMAKKEGIKAVTRYMDPFLLYASGNSSTQYLGYEGPIKVRPEEYEALQAMTQLSNFAGIRFSPMDRMNVKIKQDKATGATKAVADQDQIQGLRISPGWNRITKSLVPVLREELGPDSATYFERAVRLGLTELGRAPIAIPEDEAMLARRRKVLDIKAKNIK